MCATHGSFLTESSIERAMELHGFDRNTMEKIVIRKMLADALPGYEREVTATELRLASLRIIRNSIRLALKTDYAPEKETRLQ